MESLHVLHIKLVHENTPLHTVAIFASEMCISVDYLEGFVGISSNRDFYIYLWNCITTCLGINCMTCIV